MKTFLKFTALLILALYVWLGVDWRETGVARAEDALNSRLKRFVSSTAKTATLLELTDFDWTEACLYLPYSIGDTSKFAVDGYTLTSGIPDPGYAVDRP